MWLRDRFITRVGQAIQFWREDRADVLVAAISFYSALAFFPFLLVLIAGFGLFLQFTGWGQDSQAPIVRMVAESTSPEMARQTAGLLQNIEQEALVGAPVGLLSLLFTATALFVSLKQAFDQIWKGSAESSQGYGAIARNLLTTRLLAFLMLLVVGLLVIVVFASSLIVSAVFALVPHSRAMFWAWRETQLCVTLSLNFALITILYRVLPETRIRWTEAMQGALVAAIVWEIGRQLLAAWIIGGHYGAYGVVGTFIAMMLWLYYAAAVLLFGAEYSRVAYERRRASEAAQGPNAQKPPAGGGVTPP